MAEQTLKSRKPTFHKKRLTGTGSFLAASGIDKIQYDGHRRIRLPYLGSVRMTRPLPDGIPYEVSVRKHNGCWYASVAYWKPPTDEPHRETQSAGGVDVGINPLTMDSDGVTYDNPRGYYQAQRRLKRWQRSQARRTKDSQGWWEAHRRIDSDRRATGLRNNADHQVSRALVGKFHTLGIETLNVAGMIRAGLQPKALADAGMSRLLNQIRYKSQWYGTHLVEADQWYPSSKACSACGEVNKDLVLQPQIAGEASFVMAAACSCLVAPSPPRPVQDEIRRMAFRPYQSGEQPSHLRNCYWNQLLIEAVTAPFFPFPNA